MGEELDGECDGGHEQHEADEEPGHAVGGHVQHGDEHAEEEQRGAQVALQDQDGDADQPHDQDGAEVTGARQAHAQELAATDRQVVAVGDQVPGEEDRQRDFDELAGLNRDGAQANPHARAEGFLAQARDHREEQQEQRENAERVGVAAQHTVVAQRDQDNGGNDDRDAHEERLAEADHVPDSASLIRQVEAVDHCQAQAREGHRDRENHGIRVGGQEMDADFPDDGERDEHADLREQVRGDRIRDVERGQDVAGNADGKGQGHEAQLKKTARLSRCDRDCCH